MVSASANKRNLWKLTTHRLGWRFLGLDVAGNVIFYPMYNASRLGGWLPATVQMNPAEDGAEQRHGVMISGRPVHWKAARNLEAMVRKAVEPKGEQVSDCHSASASSSGDGPAGDAEGKAPESRVEAAARSAGKQLPTGKALRRQLRLNRFVSLTYKLVHGAVFCAGVYAVLCAGQRFRCWLNPPARAGLDGILSWLFAYPIAAWAALLAALPKEFLTAANDSVAAAWDALRSVGGPPAAAAEAMAAMWAEPAAVQWQSQAPAGCPRMKGREVARREEQAAYDEAAAEFRQIFWRRALMAFLAAISVLFFF
jgi:hypothetical protein